MDADELAEWLKAKAKIEAGEAWQPGTREKIDAAFRDFSAFDGLRPAFYMGCESANCSGMIPNEYPTDSPQHKAFKAGYRFAATTLGWGG